MTVLRFAVTGDPISHSLSPAIHLRFAKLTGIALEYTLLPLSPPEFADGVTGFFRDGGSGLNVTTPHKPAASELCAGLSGAAQLAGAVNTLLLRDGELTGHNTDGIGLLRDLQVNLETPVTGQRILLLGAGGSAHGIVAPLLGQMPQQLVIANRTPQRAVALAESFAGLGPVMGTALGQVPAVPFDLVLNATTSSLTGSVPDVASERVAGAHCYDLMYSTDGATAFTRWARDHGAARANTGMGMLIEQAAESFFTWHGVRPDSGPLLAAPSSLAATPGPQTAP